ncbi:MAG: hypothetical protein IPP66_22665 [Anaerolineales bacterium]|nr:hypothetical protein [Anaerolineales bacterium]
MELPKSRLGCKSYIKKINGEPTSYEVIDEEIFLAPSNNRKAFCLHKLKFEDGREEFRIAYYMIAEKPRMHGKWAYGQFAPMMTKDEMHIIFEKAKAKGWI